MCYYNQLTGNMLCVDNSTGGIYYDEDGYSGDWLGQDNPEWQEVYDTGPIPVGGWDVGSAYYSPNTGQNTIELIPWPDNSCYDTGRECDTFKIHGNNATNDASAGCIILPPNRTVIPQGEEVIVY
jgi:hypothetical protein